MAGVTIPGILHLSVGGALTGGFREGARVRKGFGLGMAGVTPPGTGPEENVSTRTTADMRRGKELMRSRHLDFNRSFQSQHHQDRTAQDEGHWKEFLVALAHVRPMACISCRTRRDKVLCPEPEGQQVVPAQDGEQASYSGTGRPPRAVSVRQQGGRLYTRPHDVVLLPLLQDGEELPAGKHVGQVLPPI